MTRRRPPCSAKPPTSRRGKIHRHAVDTVAQARRRRAVLEDVPEMAAAGGTMDFGADHAMAVVHRSLHRALDRVVEARPAGATLELQFRFEQRLIAAGAG